MQSLTQCSDVSEVELPYAGQQIPLPQSPDSESLEIEPLRELHPCSSSSLFERYLVPTSIINCISEDGHDVYTSTKGPDDLPGLKAWTLVI